MKTNLQIVAGGIAGLLTVVGLGVGVLVWANVEGSDSSLGTATESAHVEASAESNVEPVPSPSLETGLATTHRSRVAPEPEDWVFEEEADPYTAELDASGPVRVRRLILSTGISGHEPIGAADRFELGAQRRIYAFVDAANASDEEVALRVTFEPEEGESAGHVSLDVPAEVGRWRTWAYTRHVYTPGRWQVVVRAPDGHVVARRSFDVVE